MGKYFDALVNSMNTLASDPRTIFLGQAVAEPGTAMRNTLTEINSNKLIELPVEEDFQMGLSNGLALAGFVPISIFPRWNFVLLATNQIVNHLDKISEISRNKVGPKVIVRTGIGSIFPLHPGPQHVGDFTEAFKILCPNINVVRLDNAEMIEHEYEYALKREDGISTILIEWSDKYAE